VIDRVLPAPDLQAKAEKFARRLADGPTLAYSAVKDLMRAYTEGGVARADALLLDAAVSLFDTDDARGGIQTFLDSGPGKTKFLGR
jgi:enoyl-CoA hydratase